MAYPEYLRQRARELRTSKQLSIDELAERLALPKTTIYYWVKDLPLEPPRSNPGQRKGTAAMQEKYRLLREQAYELGRTKCPVLLKMPTFRDSVVLYIAEGYKRSRNRVQICNSDERVMAMALAWLNRVATTRLHYSLQYHADQDLEELRQFWGGVLGVEDINIEFTRKSNSGQMSGRTWRSEHGVLAVSVYDTMLRSRLQAWIDFVRGDWGLDCVGPGA
jgi:transposase-like protein